MENKILEDFQYRPDIRVVNAARVFIQSLSEVYGSNAGMKIWDYIRNGLGEQIASDIFLGMLVGSKDIVVFKIGPNKIDAIREVRALTGMVLKEAKDFVESVINTGPKPIETQNFNPTKVIEFCKSMENIGCVIK
jgi:ribosomal protein L7/L12